MKKEQVELIFQMAEKLTGSCQTGQYRREILVTNVGRRMRQTGKANIEDYLKLVSMDSSEKKHFLNSLTIHTTSWFREQAHFDYLEKHLTQLEVSSYNVKNPFQLWCAACSTGQESYTFALVLEKFRKEHEWFDYKIYGSDIDPISVDTCKRGVYQKSEIKEIHQKYHKLLWQGSGKTEDLFAIDPEIRKRCQFLNLNLTEIKSGSGKETIHNMDWVVCRNVLIYFKPDVVEGIVQGLIGRLKPSGYLCLGHSEAIEPKTFRIRPHGHCIYQSFGDEAGIVSSGQLSLLVIDDSETIRRVLKKIFDPHFSVTMAGSAAEADTFISEKTFDMITLDLHMPKTDGITWLKAVRAKGLKTPVVIVSDAHPSEAVSVLGAMERGAQDYIEKSKLNTSAEDIVSRMKEIIETFQMKSERKKFGKPAAPMNSSKKLFRPELILIGASTGGTEALTQLLKAWPSEGPPVMVVQHIAHNFSEPFAQRLALTSGLRLGKMNHGEPLEPGRLYISLGDYHIGLQKQKTQIVLTVSKSPEVSGHRPSVDFMFRSASLFKSRIAAALLTGMGKDGAKGLLELKNNSAFCMAQDEESSIVFGMPKEAIRLGATDFVGNIQGIRMKFFELMKTSAAGNLESDENTKHVDIATGISQSSKLSSRKSDSKKGAA